MFEISAIFSDINEDDRVTTPDLFLQSLEQKRQNQCSMADASQGVKFDEGQISVDKISFGVI